MCRRARDTTGTANLTGSYAVKSTGTLASLSSEYEVSVSQADNLGSSYAVKVQGDSVSLASSYDISSATAGVAVDLDSQYSVKTTGSPQSIDGEYAVKDQGNAQVLSSSYAVTDLFVILLCSCRRTNSGRCMWIPAQTKKQRCM